MIEKNIENFYTDAVEQTSNRENVSSCVKVQYTLLSVSFGISEHPREEKKMVEERVWERKQHQLFFISDPTLSDEEETDCNFNKISDLFSLRGVS